MRWLVVLAATGCGFTHGSLGPGDAPPNSDDAADDDAGMSDARGDGPAPVICNKADLDLRSCFTFDGSIVEGSSYTHSLSVANVTFGPGHDNQAVQIQSNSNITVDSTPTSFDISTFTFRMWIKPTTLPAAATRMGLLDSGNRYRLFLLPGGALRCALTNGPDLTSSTGAVVAGVWQRVACTFDGTFTRIYVNGTMKAELMQTATILTSSGGIVIGQNNPSGENFDGAIDSFQLWGSIVAP